MSTENICSLWEAKLSRCPHAQVANGTYYLVADLDWSKPSVIGKCVLQPEFLL